MKSQPKQIEMTGTELGTLINDEEFIRWNQRDTFKVDEVGTEVLGVTIKEFGMKQYGGNGSYLIEKDGKFVVVQIEDCWYKVDEVHNTIVFIGFENIAILYVNDFILDEIHTH